MDRQLRVGQIAPNFIAIDDQKKQMPLTELIHHTHLLLAFIHGTWCPHCIQTIYRLRRTASIFTQEGIQIAVIAIDDPSTLRIFRQSAVPALPFPLLSDHDQLIHKMYQLEQMSAYIALDTSQRIRGIFLDADHHSYPGHSAIVHAFH